MKVIREKQKTGPLKGIVFLNNDVNEEDRQRIGDLASKSHDNWNKTNRLTHDDITNLKNFIEISTANIAGNVIKFYDLEFNIINELNKDKTEWVMKYTLKSENNIIFEKNDFVESLNFKYKGKTVLDRIIDCKNVSLYDIYT